MFKPPLLLAAVVCALAGGSGQSRAGLPEELVQAWQARQQQLHSVRFEFSGTDFTPSGEANAPSADVRTATNPYGYSYPSEDRSVEFRGRILLDLDGGRLFRHQTGERIAMSPTGELQYHPSDKTVVFRDGKYYFYAPDRLNRNPANPSQRLLAETVISETPRQLVFSVEHLPLLWACGIVHLRIMEPPSNLRPQVLPGMLKMKGRVSGSEEELRVVSTVPDELGYHFELTVDPANPLAIRRLEGFGRPTAGDLWFSIDIDYQATELGPLPKQWSVQTYSADNDRVTVTDVRMDAFAFNPAVTDEQFEVGVDKGDRVYDVTLPKDASAFVVGGDGKPNLPPEEVALQEDAASRRNWMWGLLLATVCVVAAGVYFLRRG